MAENFNPEKLQGMIDAEARRIKKEGEFDPDKIKGMIDTEDTRIKTEENLKNTLGFGGPEDAPAGPHPEWPSAVEQDIKDLDARVAEAEKRARATAELKSALEAQRKPGPEPENLDEGSTTTPKERRELEENILKSAEASPTPPPIPKEEKKKGILGLFGQKKRPPPPPPAS